MSGRYASYWNPFLHSNHFDVTFLLAQYFCTPPLICAGQAKWYTHTNTKVSLPFVYVLHVYCIMGADQNVTPEVNRSKYLSLVSETPYVYWMNVRLICIGISQWDWGSLKACEYEVGNKIGSNWQYCFTQWRIQNFPEGVQGTDITMHKPHPFSSHPCARQGVL